MHELIKVETKSQATQWLMGNALIHAETSRIDLRSLGSALGLNFEEDDYIQFCNKVTQTCNLFDGLDYTRNAENYALTLKAANAIVLNASTNMRCVTSPPSTEKSEAVDGVQQKTKAQQDKPASVFLAEALILANEVIHNHNTAPPENESEITYLKGLVAAKTFPKSLRELGNSGSFALLANTWLYDNGYITSQFHKTREGWQMTQKAIDTGFGVQLTPILVMWTPHILTILPTLAELKAAKRKRL